MAGIRKAARSDLVGKAIRLEWLTVGWKIVEGVVAMPAGIAAGSISLIAFGADSLIELASAGVLLWRLHVELHRGAEFPALVERRASKIAGALLVALAVYIVASAAYAVWHHEGQEFSKTGFVVAAIAVPFMWSLARAKIAVAKQIGSRSLRADGIESITCGYLSGVVVLGLLAQLLFGAWWVDSITAILIVGLLLKEGREAWRGDDNND